jgi:purine-binding chemotaxis protein CheW
MSESSDRLAVSCASAGRVRALIVSSGARNWALPLHCLRETMRPQPVERVHGADEYVLGLSRIRGETVPVVELSRLIGELPEQHKRYVTVKAGERDVAVAVADVIGVCELDAAEFTALPSLVSSARSHVIEAIAYRDTRLIAVLDATRLIPAEAWEKLAAVEARPT